VEVMRALDAGGDAPALRQCAAHFARWGGAHTAHAKEVHPKP